MIVHLDYLTSIVEQLKGVDLKNVLVLQKFLIVFSKHM